MAVENSRKTIKKTIVPVTEKQLEGSLAQTRGSFLEYHLLPPIHTLPSCFRAHSPRSPSRGFEGRLQRLRTQLCMGYIRQDIKEQGTTGETFRPAFNAPLLAENVHLEFDSKDEEGLFFAPEAELKSSVFISTFPRRVTVARGASQSTDKPRPVHGVSGMAGAGKTTALIGLGHEEDIQAHFVHGVLYISIGRSANMGRIITELWKIMIITGATTSAATVLASKSLTDAITIAAVWFHGKRILFLVDDIWPTSTCPEGFLPDLEGLLQGSPESRMAISTRSQQIAKKCGSHVDFGVRDPCGQTSLSIFLANALPKTLPNNSLLESARSVLELCAGLPISLSVAGAAVSKCVNSEDDFEEACEIYLGNIQAQISLYPGSTFLENAIRLSLKALTEDFEKNDSGGHEAIHFSVGGLYTSLCVFENQQFAPVPVLARMWGLSEARADDVCVSFKSMSLAKISSETLDGRKQRGLNIHDLHLDFCRRAGARNGEEQLWHQRLLEGHITLSYTVDEVINQTDDRLGFNMLEHTPRPWWRDDAANIDYMRKHLSTHLRGAGFYLELGSTVLDIRWIFSQGRNDGVLRILHDLNILQEVVEAKLMSAKTPYPVVPVNLISRTTAGITTVFPLGIRQVYQEFSSLLFSLSKTNEGLGLFLERMKNAVPKPLLVPTIHFYQYPADDKKFDIDVKLPDQAVLDVVTTDFSSCDRYTAVGSGKDVAVFNLETQGRLKRLKGHETQVNVVRFGTTPCKLLSGSLGGVVIIWDWMATESPIHVLRGHKESVTCLSARETDSKFCSGSKDGSVRVWDMTSGELHDEISYGAEVECVSLCPTNEVVAVGTKVGRLVCRDLVTGQLVFEYNFADKSAISAVQFGRDGQVLICGSARGDATAWKCVDWEKSETVNIPGSVAHIAVHSDGLNVLLGSATGEIRHWILSNEDLSKYNVSSGYGLNGLSFRKNGNEIAYGHVKGDVLGWSGPMSNPDLDFTDVRNNILYDFSLSDDSTRVATATQDNMIRIWNCHTGTCIANYDAPTSGSRRLTLNSDGTKLASSSADGTISIWSAEGSPTDSDVTLFVKDEIVHCVSFSPGDTELLVCLEREVQIWSLETKQKLHQVPNFGCSDASFSPDGRLIIAGSTTRATIWDTQSAEIVFDTANQSMSTLSLSDGKNVIKTCCSYSHRMCPSSLLDPGTVASPLTVDNVFEFVTEQKWPAEIEFCGNVLAESFAGRLIAYEIEE